MNPDRMRRYLVRTSRGRYGLRLRDLGMTTAEAADLMQRRMRGMTWTPSTGTWSPRDTLIV